MKDRTKLIATGRPQQRPVHPVNFPVERASTLLFPTYDDFLNGAKSISYGRLGTSTHRALEETVTALESGYETKLAPSGLQAINAAILAFVKQGDTVLMVDNAYDPTRKFCERFLKRFGVDTVFYDPMIGADIDELISDKTTVVVAESPGSLTFEVQDIRAIADAAHAGGAKLIVDNTWAAGVFYRPIEHGADVSVQAGTKYLTGHSDCLIGTITSADENSARAIFMSLLQLGSNVSADDAYLTLRGVRTLNARLDIHEKNGLTLAKWLTKRPEVLRVLHPAIKGCPGHSIWKRDFSGSSGLFGAVLNPMSDAQIAAFFNSMTIFDMGFSWGGFESLCIHTHPARYRTATQWHEEGVTVRFHAGLEDVDDMIADLDRAFAVALATKE